MPSPPFAIAVKACMIQNNALLMLERRANDVHKPDQWDVPGGRLTPGENPFTGLKREVQEETGLDIIIRHPLDIHHFTRDDGQAITMIFFACTLTSPSQEVRLSEEHTTPNATRFASCVERASFQRHVLQKI